ncbi:MAG: ORF6N domain-containing protein [Candidatus Peregrinibacteria bacterium]|nr:ORF6N domain-containing protein [Candidatus Peregrinibacteria bacterium]
MKLQKNIITIDEDYIARKIYIIRGEKIMMDRDLAQLYGVETKVLNQAVRRNVNRFPKDFMFQLNGKEMDYWKSQIVTSNSTAMGLRKLPLAFTEQGVAMLSSVLSSDRAIQVNIQIMRMFTHLRKMLATHKELREKIEMLEKKYDQNFSIVFQAIKQLLDTGKEKSSKRKMGFNLTRES